jgi:hypothetical protein
MILNQGRCLVPAMQVTQFYIFSTQHFYSLYNVVYKTKKN